MAAVLYRRDGVWHVPFVARRADLPTHPGQVGLPGGGVEEGETAWEAAAREVQEEIGLQAIKLRPLGASAPVYAAVSNFCVVPFVAWMPSPDIRFVAQPSEVEAVLEIPLSLLLDPTAWRGEVGRPDRHLPFHGTSIWGLTARILDDLLPRLERGLGGDLTPSG